MPKISLTGLLFFALIFACTRDKSPTQPNPCLYPSVNIIADFEKYDRPAVEKDAFRIDSVYVRGDLLHVFVSYGGGCKEHDFQLYSTTGIYLSLPPQGDVYLGHDGHGDMCEAYLSEELIFDLTPLIVDNGGGMGLRLFQYQASEPFVTIWWRTD